MAADTPIIDGPTALVMAQSKCSFWLYFDRLRGQSHGWNWKRVHRECCALRLTLPRRRKKRVLAQPCLAVEAPAVLNVLNEGNREALAIEITTSLPSVRVVQVLEQLVAMHSVPAMMRCDSGPEVIAQTLVRWCEQHGVVLHHIQPGKPNQNALIERFNKTYRQEVPDAWVFTSLAEVREVTGGWLERYNAARPHRSLGRVPPRTLLPRSEAA